MKTSTLLHFIWQRAREYEGLNQKVIKAEVANLKLEAELAELRMKTAPPIVPVTREVLG